MYMYRKCKLPETVFGCEVHGLKKHGLTRSDCTRNTKHGLTRSDCTRNKKHGLTRFGYDVRHKIIYGELLDFR